jgi:hypothetical protein
MKLTTRLAQPKLAPPRDVYVPKPIVTRPGADDHLKCKSRRGETYVEHRLPISLAGEAL